MKKYLPIVIGTLLSIPLAIGAFFLTQGAFTRASVSKPLNVKAIKISDSKAVISWETDTQTQGVVEYGNSTTELNKYAPEILPKTKHEVELTLLTPKTPYYFVIRVGNELFDNDGLPWTFTTKATGEAGTDDVKGASSGNAGANGLGNQNPVPTTQKIDETIYRLPQSNTTMILLPTGGAGSGQTIIEPTKKLQACPKTSNCNQIKSLLGKGCSTTEYVACQQKYGTGGSVQGTNTKKSSKISPTAKPTLAVPNTAR